MSEEGVEMSQEERDCLHCLKLARDRRITQRWAAEQMGVTERWVRQLLGKLKRQGDRSVVHGLPGKPSNHKIADAVRKRARFDRAGVRRFRTYAGGRILGRATRHHRRKGDGTAVDDGSQLGAGRLDLYEAVFNGSFEERDMVLWIEFRNRKVWSEWWKQCGVEPRPPDFARFVAAGVFLGQKPHAGYQVAIVSAGRSANTLVVNYRVTDPDPNGMYAAVLTWPLDVVLIPKAAGKIVFRKAPPVKPSTNKKGMAP